MTSPRVGVANGFVVLRVTGPVQLHDGAAPAAKVDTDNKPFGTTKGRDWPEWRPFYLYAINKDNTDAGLAFGLSPSPNLRNAPAAKHLATIGNQSTMGEPSDLGMLLLVANASGLSGKPVRRIGAVAMRAKNKTNTWSIQPIDKGVGGIGEEFIGVRFAFVPSQMGAQQGSYLTPGQASDTAPATKTRAYDYVVGLDGVVRVRVSLEAIAKAGVGKSDLHLALPYASVGAPTNGPFPLYVLGEFATPNGYQAPATIAILPGKSLGAVIVQELVGASAALSAKQRNATPGDLNKVNAPVRVVRGAFAYAAF